MILLSILNPANKSEAGITLFLILLGAAIIGFIVAWLLYKARSANTNKQLETMKHELAEKKLHLKKLDDHIINIQAENNALHGELDKLTATHVVSEDTGPFMEVKDHHVVNAERLGFKVNAAGHKDNLKLIHGVGPFIESKLNDLGIFTFDQISDFNDETIHKVNEAIEYFPGRIERDHWVDQAKDLKK